MFDWIKNLFGSKGQIADVAAQTQQLAAKATDTYQKVMSDGKIDMSDVATVIAGAKDMSQDIKDIATDVTKIATDVKSTPTPTA